MTNLSNYIPSKPVATAMALSLILSLLMLCGVSASMIRTQANVTDVYAALHGGTRSPAQKLAQVCNPNVDADCAIEDIF